ncbi:MAG TPA: zinc ribbon domain-containing protein [Candidatus Rifleibacterium sp.]|nr:zinc ribbon domain-containing protein [Candidatus Rifleibacterium sp.]HPT47853.1 zinc ribbon domain-containing protein [Candidatus Rifleibacterium sp.]
MKRISMVLVLLLFVAIAPLYGLYCIECGRSLPAQARFCPWCGNSAANGANTPAAAMETALRPRDTARPTPGVSPADYLYVGQFEELLRKNDLRAVIGEVRDYWRLNDIRAAGVISARANLNQYQRKMHDLHARKFDLLNNYLEAWRRETEDRDLAMATAEKQRAAFAVAQINLAIDELVTGNGTQSSFRRVEAIERRMRESSQNNRVTAGYLVVGEQRLPRGEPIWVIEVVSNFARIMHMGESNSSSPLVGWVTLYDLERRTNWRPDPAIFHAPPSKPLAFSALHTAPTRVVIFSEITNPRHDYDRKRYLRARRRANKETSSRITRTRVRKPERVRDRSRKDTQRKHQSGHGPRPRLHGHHRP